jgi:hypothetical protein
VLSYAGSNAITLAPAPAMPDAVGQAALGGASGGALWRDAETKTVVTARETFLGHRTQILSYKLWEQQTSIFARDTITISR